MAFVTHVSTVVPSHSITQVRAATLLTRAFGLDRARSDVLEEVCSNAKIARRCTVLAPDMLEERRSLSTTMGLYREHAARLAALAVTGCLRAADLPPHAIDFVITSSCTGVMLPSLSAMIVDSVALRSDVRRLPITELGCAGGASALARAYEFVRGFPEANVLVVAVELPSLTLQHDDTSSANLIASAIFGDGAAAVLIRGNADSGLEIIDTRTEMFPDSLDKMGFDLRDRGLHVVLSPHVPRLLAEHTPRLVERLLHQHALTSDNLDFYAIHPGGRRLLEALQDALELDEVATRHSWDVLRDYGNQSSASVLFVLARLLEQVDGPDGPRGHGILGAFGPGITAEFALLRTVAKHARPARGAPC